MTFSMQSDRMHQATNKTIYDTGEYVQVSYKMTDWCFPKTALEISCVQPLDFSIQDTSSIELILKVNIKRKYNWYKHVFRAFHVKQSRH